MTYDEVVNEILALRFSESQRAQAQHWVAFRFAQLWALREWTFRYATDPVRVSAGSQSVTGLATDFQVVLALYDSDGERLRYLDPGDFYDLYANTTDQGSPKDFTVLNGAITVGPIPDTTATDWLLTYEQKLPTLNAGSQIPGLPAEHHYMLVDGGLAHGLRLYQDPSWQDMEAVWQQDIDALAHDYLVDQRGEPVQWGAHELSEF